MEKDSQPGWDNSKNKTNIYTAEMDLKIDESHKSQDKILIREQCVIPQSVVSSNSTTAVINPLKNTSSCETSIVHISSQQNEHPKTFPRRNQGQPLLKKPMNNAPTTSIKPLILPAPSSDSFSQHAKSNIVSLQSSHQPSSISTPFNCSQPMTMGIATIQPQHFSYQNISNNRIPMLPMSIQNNYNTQQLTLTNGGLGTTVQLMPVMNQSNNQMNNSRVQSVPLFMTPILGSHGGMLFQPNMTLMPQNSNPMTTFNIANTSYSHDFSHCQPILSHPITATTASSVQRHSIVVATEIGPSSTKTDSDPMTITNTTTNVTATILPGTENNFSHAIKVTPSPTVPDPPGTARPNVKQRGLIRTQIYRMKPFSNGDVNGKEVKEDSPLVTDSISVHDDHEEAASVQWDDEKIDKNGVVSSAHQSEAVAVETEDVIPPLSPPTAPIISVQASIVDPTPESPPAKNPSPVTPHHITAPSRHKTTEPKPLPSKRRLPSPEILDTAQPTKVARISHNHRYNSGVDAEDTDEKRPLPGRRSPGSLFDKISHVIPERKPEILQSNRAAKLTAVVRPEQRKMLVHYLDDLVIFESDEPFPTTNKMQVVKSALKAGNIKLTPQKSRLFNDQYSYLSGEEDLSPTKIKSKSASKLSSPATLKSTSFLEPLTIDIPTTTSSSCDSLDSSQVRPLSMCSYQSTLPASLTKKASIDNLSPEKDMPKIEKERSISSVRSELVQEKEVGKMPDAVCDTIKNVEPKSVAVVKEPLPPPILKALSPVKPAVAEKNGLDRPICEWTVADVVDFVKQTPGCDNYGSLFQNHEIDGEALLLLSKDNLIQGALNMKIGPALKLCARIDKRKALDPQ